MKTQEYKPAEFIIAFNYEKNSQHEWDRHLRGKTRIAKAIGCEVEELPDEDNAEVIEVTITGNRNIKAHESFYHNMRI